MGPRPGSYVPLDVHHLLAQMSMEQMDGETGKYFSFEKGEYVGYELEDLEEGNEESETGDVYSTYIYAVIVEEAMDRKIKGEEDKFGLRKKFKVNVGEDREAKTVEATDLYKFIRPEDRLHDSAAWEERMKEREERRKAAREEREAKWRDEEEAEKLEEKEGRKKKKRMKTSPDGE